MVIRLKQDFPGLPMVINGGIQTLEQAVGFLDRLDGTMIGRAAYQTPWLLADADRLIFSDPRPPPSPHEVLDAFVPYVERELAAGVPLNSITRHILGLFQGRPGARRWRRHLSEQAHRPGAGVEVLLDAAAMVH
jgi:tRNA-dihydrouridine synthase A